VSDHLIDLDEYRPGRALVGGLHPQSNPELFTDAVLRAEIKYLLGLNRRYGTHILRVQAYQRLTAILAERNS
jgi:hypothetical protein